MNVCVEGRARVTKIEYRLVKGPNPLGEVEKIEIKEESL